MRIPRLMTFTPKHIRQLALLFVVGFTIFLCLRGTINVLHLNTPADIQEAEEPPPPPIIVVPNDFNQQLQSGTRRLNIQYENVKPNGDSLFARITTDRGRGLLSVYPRNEDEASDVLLSQGPYLTVLTDTLQTIFACDLDMHLIDIGFGLGLLPLVAWKWHRMSVAVDASLDNVKLLQQTISREGMKDITVLHNAVYDETAFLHISQPWANRSAAFLNIDRDSEELLSIKSYDISQPKRSMAPTIYMDDLKPVLKSMGIRKAVLRMDLDDSKYNALVESRGFFKEYAEIPYILMNWTWKKKSTSNLAAKGVVQYLHSIGYKPYPSFFKNEELDMEHTETWPHEIIWLHENELCTTWPDLSEVRKAYRTAHYNSPNKL